MRSVNSKQDVLAKEITKIPNPFVELVFGACIRSITE